MDSKIRRGGFTSPQETANFLSLIFFGWTLPLLWKGGKQVLGIEDLYSPLKSDESKSLGDRLEREWVKEVRKAERSSELCENGKTIKAKRPSLTLAIARTFWDFLLLDEVKCDESLGISEVYSQIDHGITIDINKVAANWVHGQLPPTLRELTMTVKSRSLCTIVGPVASGKSTLLHLLLGELPLGSGRVSLLAGENNQTKITHRDIRISYSSQDPWLFSASVRDNILFGQPYEETRYQEVIRVCALLEDFEQLPQGDLSFVGERGASLSGGQRARVNLARAVYRDAELYLLNDSLSAVDARVGRHLFEECITGYLKDKTRILVTHQQQYLRQADTIVVLDRVRTQLT